MNDFTIEGGIPICGRATIHGAKNAVLPIMAATMLTGKTTLYNCPALSDVCAAAEILQNFGCKVTHDGDVLSVDAEEVECCDLSERLSREMRSSILFLGAMLGRCGRARISFPGGCELGPRPVDLHIAGLRKLGAVIHEEHGMLDCIVPNRLKGTSIALPFPSVGATENIILAAVTARGETILTNAAREPEITDLADFLNKCGADITVSGDSIRIKGVERLHGCEYTVIPDRIEAATFLSAAAATGGEILLERAEPKHLSAVLPFFEEMGCRLCVKNDTIELKAPKKLSSVGVIKTMPYPGFPTDAQAPLMAALCLSKGSTMFIETIFEARYKHVGELVRMGARIRTEGRVALVEGADSLCGAPVRCTDLRGGAALAVAALAAKGTTTLSDIRHIERGYCDFAAQLRLLGARIS
ncbi:MAG: UDP-N-acetylglucosamine 1-carboxyvinyltransferase [Oscillospiraceae bacterium]|nr:UDP-N-acetylglucosamine 1-carboxyvinyltransferase [Oscillospiraceae bacterium]